MNLHLRRIPERIVCLTEEPTELLYLLGEQQRIVGISAYSVRPEGVGKRHPVVSAYIGGSIPKICALKPDLIIGFSDIQAQLAHDLIKANQQVLIFNQRSVQDILDVIITIGQIVDQRDKAAALVRGYIQRLEEMAARHASRTPRPMVYFEEWDEPRISAIQWVSELLEYAGGRNIFAHKATGRLAAERIVSDEAILQANPDIIVACWCGKTVDLNAIATRPGYASLSAVKSGRLHELDPSIILQPGPACLTDGVDALEQLLWPTADNF